jgi:O-methyltransferase involved in polyketide biosynthesis
LTSSAPRAEAIGPTAHYTAAVWARHGLSHPALVTPTGRLLFNAWRPAMAASKAFGGPTVEGFLLGRHRLIDHLLDGAIEDGRIAQVIEIACGLSPRGWRFARRYGDRLTYVEADLPYMAARKRSALAELGSLGDHHRVVEIDALRDEGPESLSDVAARLDAERGLAIVTEGLISYLDHDGMIGLWRRIARTLAGFGHGLYLSDLLLGSENTGVATAAFVRLLSAFVRGRVELHFRDAPEALEALEAAGFADATLHSPAEVGDRFGLAERDVRPVRVIEATAYGAGGLI